jgi:penicillin-insensitive murein endopeptidase
MTQRLIFSAFLRVFVAFAALGASIAHAQDTAAEEAARRAAVLAQLPADAAKRVFGTVGTPAPGVPHAIGSYTKGCLAGGVQLPADGPNWQVMRPSRNRSWGHPVLISFIEKLAAAMPQINGWPGLLIGDLAQPRGGPMLTGHTSHQLGIEGDIWLVPLPDRRLSPAERDEMLSTNVVAADKLDVDPAVWSPAYRKLLEAVARQPGVARIFVNAAIKRALCREAGADRAWLSRIRPWWGHNYHFHVRLSCPAGDPCEGQPPPAADDGCGKDLDWWFTAAALHPPPPSERVKSPKVADLPRACASLVSRP